MKTRIFALALCLLLAGCGNSPKSSVNEDPDTAPQITFPEIESGTVFSGDTASFPEDGAAVVTLTGESAECSSDAVIIDGGKVTVTDEGTYIFRGTLDDGMIIVSADKSDKTTLVLDGVSVASGSSAAVYIASADEVEIFVSTDSVNYLSCGEQFTPIDDSNIDGAIFSRDDLSLGGDGALHVISPGGHGIVAKDDLEIRDISLTVTAAAHGIRANDSVTFENASLMATVGKDGIHAENSDDATLGSVVINGGAYTVDARGDGISAASTLDITSGDFVITTGGGSENGDTSVSDSFGGFPGGMGHGGGKPGMGGMGGMGDMGSTETDESTDDEGSSIKGIKSSGHMTVSGGTFSIDSADDSLHSNASITISGGEFSLSSGDDGIHADEALTITDGIINITESYEGLEALHLLICGGEAMIVSTDDGLNAAGGNDNSGFGGMHGDSFGGPGGGMGQMSQGNGTIIISGGKLDITASGDGIDANGSIEITGGYTVVRGPVMGDTATLDYDTSATISGGTFIGSGASGMAQTFSSSTQGVIPVNVGSRSAGTAVSVISDDGDEVLSFSPTIDFAVIIVSSPNIVSGESYTLNVGSDSAPVTAS